MSISNKYLPVKIFLLLKVMAYVAFCYRPQKVDREIRIVTGTIAYLKFVLIIRVVDMPVLGGVFLATKSLAIGQSMNI